MTYELKLEQSDVVLIMQALGEVPLRVGLVTFGKVQQQVQAQDEASALEVKK